MSKMIRSHVALAAVVLMAGAAGFAQSSGEAVYKANAKAATEPKARRIRESPR